MKWFGTGPELDRQHIVDGYNWGNLQNGTVVDIGGSLGSLTTAIAKKFPSLHCIVQDREEIVHIGQGTLDAGLKDRVTFMAHDFFLEQPVKGADVYLLRWILHDWSDTYAIKIIRALIPALEHTSRVVICDHIVPAPGTVSAFKERRSR